jgi:hypothetical protein
MSELLECGHPESPHDGFTSGYGKDADGNRYCYACCAERDREAMIADGQITLYLVKRGEEYHITNWPGSLDFIPYYVLKSPRGGGFGAQRTDAWFTGPDGKRWHAVNRGDMDLARCRRTKS